MVREFRDVMASCYTDPDGFVGRPIEAKTIVFAVTKRHAKTLAQILDVY